MLLFSSLKLPLSNAYENKANAHVPLGAWPFVLIMCKGVVALRLGRSCGSTPFLFGKAEVLLNLSGNETTFIWKDGIMVITNEQRQQAQSFANQWKNKGNEKQHTQTFWNGLLQNVFKQDVTSGFIVYEKPVQLNHQSYIDAYIPSTKILIEQKSLGVDLRVPQLQSDKTLLDAFGQAKRYVGDMKASEKPRWIITCDFKSFLIYDLETPHCEPEEILLENLSKEYHRLEFLVNPDKDLPKKEMELSITAGEIVGKLYEALHKQYNNPDSEKSLKSLNMLCVRLVFCLYAEDAGLFPRNSFHDYLIQFDANHLRKGLLELFKILDTKPELRDEYETELGQFPYVNGGLFTEEDRAIPQLTEEIRQLLLKKASEDFDWSEISPTIFGAVFESTLNPETRRNGGMHYTSIENIHKVIDPLFLNELRKEFDEICFKYKVDKTRNEYLSALQLKMAGLNFLDPACGSGNFLTETYISLRRLENEILRTKGTNLSFGDEFSPIKISIQQFYGIEINDFACTIAKTALWIAESQMFAETKDILNKNIQDFLPLKSYANIVEGNALRIEWDKIIPNKKLSYIMGNPPFIGAMNNSSESRVKQDIELLFGKGFGELDYVGGWYRKAANYMKGTSISAAFVSTNSISQGQQPALLWKNLNEEGFHINFAYRTFRWDSEANEKAHVYCVIEGFSYKNEKEKKLFYTTKDGDIRCENAKNINAYLVDYPMIFVENQKTPLCKIPEIVWGSQPRSKKLILSDEEKDELIRENPRSSRWIKPYWGADEFINRKPRWCLWLVNVDPEKIRECNEVNRRIKMVRNERMAMCKASQKFAKTPTLFAQIAQPKSDYLMIPLHSSENREYIPIGFMTKDDIASNATEIIPNTTLFHFGVLTSSVHMVWMRAVCGRIKSDYRYSKEIVYNNFPWPNPTEKQKKEIEKTAQAIINERKKYPNSSFASLYDPNLMPKSLRKAHEANDKAVENAYGKKFKNEAECVAYLFSQYDQLIKKNHSNRTR